VCYFQPSDVGWPLSDVTLRDLHLRKSVRVCVCVCVCVCNHIGVVRVNAPQKPSPREIAWEQS
jgi:hypothetical protein